MDPMQEGAKANSRMLRQAFIDVLECLEVELQRKPYLMVLDPMRWESWYIALTDKGEDESADTRHSVITCAIEESVTESQEIEPDTIRGAVENLRVSLADLDPHDVSAAAGAYLERAQFSLGWTPRDSKNRNWALDKDTELTPKFLQVAINDALEKPGDEHDQVPRNVMACELAAGLNVPNYLSEPGLIDSRRTARVFVAEHLYTFAHEVNKAHVEDKDHIDPLEVGTYFLPIKGLGQWRGAASWLIEGETNVVQSHMRTFQGMINTLLSMKIIDLFVQSLSRAMTVRGGQRRRELCSSFAMLWWADSIVLAAGERPIRIVERDKDGHLDETIIDETAADRLSESIRRALRSDAGVALHDDDPTGTDHRLRAATRLITIDLETISDISRAELAGLIGCDRVLFRVPFFDVDSFPASSRGYLRERIRAMLRSQRYQQIGANAVAAGDAWHFLKSLLDLTGWRGAQKTAMQHLDQGTPLSSDDLVGITRTINQLEFVDACAVLLRFLGHVKSGELDKFTTWVTEDSIMTWDEDRAQTIDRYRRYIRRYVRHIAAAMEWKAPIHFRPNGGGGGGEEDSDADGDSPSRIGADFKDWVREFKALPPFSAQGGYDSHLVTMLVLAEPLKNAIEHGSECPNSLLRIGIDESTHNDQFAVRVRVENRIDKRTASRLNRSPPRGLTQARRLLSGSQFATISELRITPDEDDPEGVLASVDVILHPRIIAERIWERNRKLTVQ